MTTDTEPGSRESIPDTTTAYKSPSWGTWTRRLVIVVLLVAAVFAITLLRPVMQILMLSSIITFLLFAPARAITRRTPLPYAASVILFYVLFIALCVFMILILIPATIRWGDDLIDSIETAYIDLRADLEAYEPEDGLLEILGAEIDLHPIIEPTRTIMLGTSDGQEPLVTETAETPSPTAAPGELEPESDNLLDLLQVDLREMFNSLVGVVGSLTGTLTSVLSSIAGFLFQIFMVLLLSFVMLLDVPRTYNAFFEWIPVDYQREYALLLDHITGVWNGFFRGQMTIGVIIAILTWLQLRLTGIPGAEWLALFTGIVSLIPSIGGYIALGPMAFVALIQGSTVFPDMARGLVLLLVVVGSVILQNIIWNFITPKIIGNAVSLPLPVVMVGVIIGYTIGGILGAFLFSPILGTLRVILEYVLSKLRGKDPYPNEPEPALLREGLFAPPKRASYKKIRLGSWKR